MILIRTKHVKVGDTVKIIAGAQKGIVGAILSIDKKKAVATIKNVANRIKFLKKQNNADSKQIEIQKPIHVSNLMLWDEATNSCSRIGYKMINKQKIRYFKKSGLIL